ncbi:hypothetical protein [Helicobacter sp. 11S02596-1]|uniref:hypothetical protein n=1 Tax=Helicobacter sp. 11S02596-1 TaxID=1476194 RepID=UPI000BA70238|nr:hypothetical protein [Helicobacter sp. 11S02596-1]PAF42821.1 hypothetical protein BJI48_06095 [Helicobacter sp. 11S02596-1]
MIFAISPKKIVKNILLIIILFNFIYTPTIKAQDNSSNPTNTLENSLLKQHSDFDIYVSYLRQNYPEAFLIGIVNPYEEKYNENTPKSLTDMTAFYDPYFLDFSPTPDLPTSIRVYHRGFNWSDIPRSFKRFYNTYIK